MEEWATIILPPTPPLPLDRLAVSRPDGRGGLPNAQIWNLDGGVDPAVALAGSGDADEEHRREATIAPVSGIGSESSSLHWDPAAGPAIPFAAPRNTGGNVPPRPRCRRRTRHASFGSNVVLGRFLPWFGRSGEGGMGGGGSKNREGRDKCERRGS